MEAQVLTLNGNSFVFHFWHFCALGYLRMYVRSGGSGVMVLRKVDIDIGFWQALLEVVRGASDLVCFSLNQNIIT